MENTMKDYYNEMIKLEYIEYQKNKFIKNQEKKNATVDESKFNSNYYISLFKHSKEHEERLGKDLYDFTAYEILDFYKARSISSIASLYVMNRTLKDYANWALDHNLIKDRQNHFIEISVELLEKCINKIVAKLKIVDRDTIYDWCDQLPNDSDAFVLLCLFEGINGKDRQEIWSAVLDNFDFDKKVYRRADGTEIPVSAKLLGLAESSNNELSYTSYSIDDITSPSEKVIEMKENGKIIKVANNAEIIINHDDKESFKEGRRIYNKIMRSLKFLGVFDYMDQNAIITSGKIHFIKTRCKELGITPYEFLYSEYIEELNKQFNVRVVRSTFWARFKSVLA